MNNTNSETTKNIMYGVSEETLVLTRKGYYSIKSLENQKVEVWNGNEWSLVTVKLTAERRHLITIYFSNGNRLTCTPNYQFIIGDGHIKESQRIVAQLLAPGLKLRQESFPIIDGDEPFNAPFIHGALCAFGCFTQNGPILDIIGALAQEVLNDPDMITIPESGNKLFPENLPEPYMVPMKSSMNTKIKWLNGLLNTRSFSVPMGLVVFHFNEKFLQDIQLFLTTLGSYSIITQSIPYKIPVSGNENIIGRNYLLMIPWYYYGKLCDLGLKIKNLSETIPKNENKIDLLITDIIDVGRLSPTYCFIEDKNNAAIFNGVLTGC